MAKIFGTEGDDFILRDTLSPGVTSDPAGLTGTEPGDLLDVIYGYGGNDTIEFGFWSDIAYGGEGNDIIDARLGGRPTAAFLVLEGGPGNDLLLGSDGRDVLDMGYPNGDTAEAAGKDTLIGGKGDDGYFVDSYGDRVIEKPGEGTDFVETNLAFYRLPTNFEDLFIIDFANEKPTIGIGNSADNFINSLFGGVVLGRAGDDTIFAGGGAYVVRGGAGNDEIVAYDVLDDGNAHRDLLHGGDGNDRLTGDGGGDCLIGGRGQDVFVYNLTSDSTPESRDTIKPGGGARAFEGAGAEAGDLIDLSNMDADATDDDFSQLTFGGTGKGQVSVVDWGWHTLVRANVDDTPEFEFEVLIADGRVKAEEYTIDDFVLTFA